MKSAKEIAWEVASRKMHDAISDVTRLRAKLRHAQWLKKLAIQNFELAYDIYDNSLAEKK
jgi:hypothetical protein